jgi:hypothetical protein
MTRPGTHTREQVARIRAAAAVLLPGHAESPAADVLPDYDELVQVAAAAVGEGRALPAAIEALPDEPTWESLSTLADTDPASFEQVSLVAVGAYFMSPAVLASLGLPTGERRPADREQVVDELSTGILDAVYERGCPVRTLDDVNGATR